MLPILQLINLDYIHWNPVKHGYVERVVDWPYSTFHRCVDEAIYPPDWCGGAGVDDLEGSAVNDGVPMIHGNVK